MNAIHFISGTPRSGSTLLSALLRQNSALHAHMTTPVLAMQQALYSTMGATQEWSAFITDAQRARDEGGAHLFYEDVPAEKIARHQSRWSAKLPTIAALFPEARDRLRARVLGHRFRAAVHAQPPVVEAVQSRQRHDGLCRTLSGPTAPWVFTWHAVREALFGAFSNRMILIDYEALTRSGARWNISTACWAWPRSSTTSTTSNSTRLTNLTRIGLPGMHSVRRKVEYVERRTILPPNCSTVFAEWIRRRSSLRSSAYLCAFDAG
jgi:sulfotransferase